jgi:hypothetical protein
MGAGVADHETDDRRRSWEAPVRAPLDGSDCRLLEQAVVGIERHQIVRHQAVERVSGGGLVEQRRMHLPEPELLECTQDPPCITHRVIQSIPRVIVIDADRHHVLRLPPAPGDGGPTSRCTCETIGSRSATDLRIASRLATQAGPPRQENRDPPRSAQAPQ